MRVPLLNFEGGPRVLLLNFEGGPGVPLLNFTGVPGPTLNFEGVPGPGSQGPEVPGPWVLVPLLHHANNDYTNVMKVYEEYIKLRTDSKHKKHRKTKKLVFQKNR